MGPKPLIKPLDKAGILAHASGMGLPNQPVTLTPDQIADLERLLSDMRHSINGDLAVFSAAGEILHLDAAKAAKFAPALVERPGQIVQKIRAFSDEFERILKITRDPIA
jgi:hypothetical protein